MNYIENCSPNKPLNRNLPHPGRGRQGHDIVHKDHWREENSALRVANPLSSIVNPPERTHMNQSDRFRGCLLGLAVGDAVGTTVEFRPRGSFEPLTDMVGGGPFHLAPVSEIFTNG